jgi:hypothetical protein
MNSLLKAKAFTKSQLLFVALFVAAGLPFIISNPALAADVAGVKETQDFIRTVISVIAGFAGLVAAGFFVVGGFIYITSSGNPERLDRAKHTLLYSSIGLAIVIAAFVISNIIVEIASNAFGG